MSYIQLLKMNDASNMNNNPEKQVVLSSIDEVNLSEQTMENAHVQKMKENLGLNTNSRVNDLAQRSLELKEKVSEYLEKPQHENIPSVKLVRNEIFKSYDIEKNFKVRS